MIEKRKKQFINSILILIFLIGLFITVYTLYSIYIGKVKEEKLIEEYEKSISSTESNIDKEVIDNKDPKDHTDISENIKEESKVWALLEINNIDLKAPILNGLSDENLKYAVVHFENSSLPGEIGNCILAAHNNIYGSIFKDLNKLEGGDIVSISYNKNIYRYEVYDKKYIEPSDLSAVEESKQKELTLITCSDNAKRRVVIKGILIN